MRESESNKCIKFYCILIFTVQDRERGRDRDRESEYNNSNTNNNNRSLGGWADREDTLLPPSPTVIVQSLHLEASEADVSVMVLQMLPFIELYYLLALRRGGAVV